MAALTAWKFNSPSGADAALGKLESMQDRALIQVHDTAVVSWEPDQKKPVTHQSHSGTKTGALGGGFWGMLFGLIFFVPILGLAMGAAAGAMFGSLRDAGISDDFVSDIRAKVTPGTSALFLVSSDAVVDKVAGELRETDAELIQSNLTQEQDAKLREAFANET